MADAGAVVAPTVEDTTPTVKDTTPPTTTTTTTAAAAADTAAADTTTTAAAADTGAATGATTTAAATTTATAAGAAADNGDSGAAAADYNNTTWPRVFQEMNKFMNRKDLEIEPTAEKAPGCQIKTTVKADASDDKKCRFILGILSNISSYGHAVIVSPEEFDRIPSQPTVDFVMKTTSGNLILAYDWFVNGGLESLPDHLALVKNDSMCVLNGLPAGAKAFYENSAAMTSGHIPDFSKAPEILGMTFSVLKSLNPGCPALGEEPPYKQGDIIFRLTNGLIFVCFSCVFKHSEIAQRDANFEKARIALEDHLKSEEPDEEVTKRLRGELNKAASAGQWMRGPCQTSGVIVSKKGFPGVTTYGTAPTTEQACKAVYSGGSFKVLGRGDKSIPTVGLLCSFWITDDGEVAIGTLYPLSQQSFDKQINGKQDAKDAIEKVLA